MAAPWRVLHLEDSARDAELIQNELRNGIFNAEIVLAQNRDDFQQALQTREFDLILADWNLPSFSGGEALEWSFRQAPETPFIFVSATMGEELAVDCLKRGATDCVSKEHLPRLRPAVLRALAQRRERQLRQTALEQLRQNEHDLADFFEHAPIGLHWAGPDGLILRVNQAELDLTGYAREEYLGRPAAQFHQNPQLLRAALEQLARGETVPTFESQLLCKNGSVVEVLISLDALRRDGTLVHARCFTRDITRARREEALNAALNLQLVNAARLAGMEEVASNVLHNVGNVLNNVNVSALTAIERVTHSRLSALIQVAELVRSHADDLAQFVATDPRGQKLPGYLETLARYWSDEQALLLRELRRLTVSVNHIKDVVSRQQFLTGPAGRAESVSISALIDDSVAIAIAGADRLGIRIRRDYTIDFSLLVDRRKLMLILVNLLGNARDAVAEVESKNRQIAVRSELLPEGHVRVEVQDNGAGISAENLSRIFDRGFTTKKDGHGFGLHSSALAARELGGSIEAQSEGPGRGARFTVIIPLAQGIRKDGP